MDSSQLLGSTPSHRPTGSSGAAMCTVLSSCLAASVASAAAASSPRCSSSVAILLLSIAQMVRAEGCTAGAGAAFETLGAADGRGAGGRCGLSLSSEMYLPPALGRNCGPSPVERACSSPQDVLCPPPTVSSSSPHIRLRIPSLTGVRLGMPHPPSVCACDAIPRATAQRLLHHLLAHPRATGSLTWKGRALEVAVGQPPQKHRQSIQWAGWLVP